MSRSLRHTGALFFLAASTMVLASACAPDESSLFIHGALVVPSTTCEVKSDSSALLQSSGILDTSVGTADSNNNLIPFPYSGALLVGNQLVRRGDPDRLRIETSRIEIYGADITVKTTSGDIFTRSTGSSAEFFVPTSGFVDPGTGSAPGTGVAFIEMIDPALARDLRKQIEKTGFEQQVIVEVVLHGRSLGGNELRSAPWPFPVRVCKGCLCDVGPCLAVSGDDKPAVNCHVGRDAIVDCRVGVVGCPPCDGLPGCPN